MATFNLLEGIKGSCIYGSHLVEFKLTKSSSSLELYMEDSEAITIIKLNNLEDLKQLSTNLQNAISEIENAN